MKVMIIKELMTGDVSPVAMFLGLQARVVTHVLARVVTHVLARVIMHVHDYYLKTCSRDALYLEVAQLRRQKWVSLPQLDVSFFKKCPPLYYHICQFTIEFPLHLKSILT